MKLKQESISKSNNHITPDQVNLIEKVDNPLKEAARILTEARQKDAADCTAAVTAALKKYNCSIFWVETKANGQLVSGEHQIRPNNNQNQTQ